MPVVAIGLAACALLAGCAGSGSGPLADPAADLAALRDQRRVDPAEPYWPFSLAEAHYRAGDLPAAQACLDTALTLAPDYVPAIALQAKLEYDGGRFAAGAARLEDYLARHAEAPDALRVALSLHRQALGEPERAAEALLACRDRSGPVLTAQACALLHGDGFATSLPLAEAAVADDPRSAANQNNLGISLLYAGRAEAAREAFRRAQELDPRSPACLYNLAIVENFYFFDHAKGREYFRRYREVAKGDPVADPDDLGTILAPAGDVQASLTDNDRGGADD